MEKKISVIIPCYNVEKIVSRCLDSIIEQSIGIDSLEVIAVDDASTDGTVEVLEQYEKDFPDNIMIIKCENNGRQGTARNIGLLYATGDYISFVDADDRIHKDMYKILCGIVSDTKCDIVQFRHKGRMENEADETIDEVKYEIYEYDSCENRKKYALNSNVMNESCWQKFYTREIINRAGVNFAEGVSYEEPLFTYPLKFFVDKVAVTEVPLYYYIYNEQGTTANYMSKPSKILEHLQVQQQVYEFMRNIPQYSVYKEEIELYIIHTFYVETFYFMKYRGYGVAAGLFRYMCKWLIETIPESIHNPYFDDISLKEEKKLVSLINTDVLSCSDEQLQQILDDASAKLV